MTTAVEYDNCFIIATVDGGGYPEPTTESFIQRGEGYPSCGSGPVYIQKDIIDPNFTLHKVLRHGSHADWTDTYIGFPVVSSNRILRVEPQCSAFFCRFHWTIRRSDAIFWGYCQASSDSKYWMISIVGCPLGERSAQSSEWWADNYTYRTSYEWQEYPEPSYVFGTVASICSRLKPKQSYYPKLGSYAWELDVTVVSDTIRFSGNRDAFSFWNSHANYRLGYYSTSMPVGGFYRAFYDAIDKLPKAQVNMFGNIIQLASTLKSFSKGYKPIRDFISTAKEAWLSYRYSYKTTKSDIKEISSVLERLCTISGCVTTYGYRYEYGISYHVAVEVDSKYLLPSDIYQKCKKLGFEISATNAWDLIPWSFVVDWVLQIDSICEALDSWLKAAEIPVSSVWYSFSCQNPDKPEAYCYGRWDGEPPSLPCIRYSSTSGKTIGMRIVDVLALTP